MTDRLVALKDEVIEGMVSFMTPNDDDPEFDPGYTQQHVERCAAILDQFLASVSRVAGPSKKEEIVEAVKMTVLDLNALNNETKGALIETDQREQICELIISAANEAGLKTSEDITEEWRDW